MSVDQADGLDAAIPPSELLRALTRSIEEEAKPMRDLIADEDSDCITRDLRAARLEGLDWCLRLLRAAERWEW
jgi:hypothetical protein